MKATITCAWLVLSTALAASLPAQRIAETPLDAVVTGDVAYESSTERYLTVWWEPAESDDVGTVVGTVVDPAGSVLEGPFPITEGAVRTRPRVASVRLRKAFVVVWHDEDNLHAAAVDAVTAEVSAVESWAPMPNDPQWYDRADFDIGGESSLHGDVATVVWPRNEVPTAVLGVKLRVLPAGAGLTVGSEMLIDNGSYRPPILGLPGAWAPCEAVAISKSGGSSGNHLVVWRSGAALLYRVVDPSLRRLADGSSTAYPSITQRPYVDGDGSNWVVSNTRLWTGEERAVELEAWSYDGAERLRYRGGDFFMPLPEVVIGGLAWSEGSVLVSFSRFVGGKHELFLATVDSFRCTPCESTIYLGAMEFPSHFSPQQELPIATDFGGGAVTPHGAALVLWSGERPFGAPGTYVRPFAATDGLVAEIGPSCGDGGTTYVTCAREMVGGSLWFQLLRARGRAGAILMMSPVVRPVSCGVCTLIPDPAFAVVTATMTTSFDGDASYALLYPDVRAMFGVQLAAQWFVHTATPSGCLGHDLSNALRIRIQ